MQENKWRLLSRSLTRFREECSTIKIQTRHSLYKMVPEKFQFGKIVKLAKHSTEKVPVFA